MAVPNDTGWRLQREIAARNETAIVAAARRLLEEPEIDADSLDMRRVARIAGVGVGTVYRRFGDKAGLLAAIVGEDERRLQEALLSGPPPLGPGAPASERLAAFLSALVKLTEENLGVLLVTDSVVQGGRLGLGAYQAWRLHVSALLSELHPTATAAESGWYADALLAPLGPDLYAHQRQRRGITMRQITQNLIVLAAAVSARRARPAKAPARAEARAPRPARRS